MKQHIKESSVATMPESNAKSKADVEAEQAQRDYESTMCFWVLCFGLLLLVIGVFILPYDHRYFVGQHIHDDDDDDAFNHYHAHSDDDDDDDNSHHYFYHYARDGDAKINTESLPHEELLAREYLGTHARYRGCESDEHREELRTAAEDLVLDTQKMHNLGKSWWPESLQVPSARVEFDEFEGTVHFSIEAPYLPRDAAYVASFEPFQDKHGAAWTEKKTLLHVPNACQSARGVKFDSNDEQYNALWAHSPNALYNANSVPATITKFGSYRTYNGWTLNATKCSSVRYSLHTTAEKLKQCASSASGESLVTFSNNGVLAAVAGVLWLNLVWPQEGGKSVGYAQWPFSFSLYVDTFESKVSIVDIEGQHYTALTAYAPTSDALKIKERVQLAQQLAAKAKQSDDTLRAVSEMDLKVGRLCWRTYTTLVGAWFSAAEDEKFFGINRTLDTTLHQRRALRLRLRTTSAADAAALAVSKTEEASLEQKASRMAPTYAVVGLVPSLRGQLDVDDYGHFSIVQADFERGAQNATLVCVTHGSEIECHREWTLVLMPKTPELYEDSFEVRMCEKNAATKKCDVAHPDHRVRVDVAVTDPSLDVAEVKQMQIELSSHLNSAASSNLNEFRGGDRVCMQAYAVGPPILMQSIDLRMVGASLCVPNKRDSNEHAPLPTRTQLAGVAGSIQDYLRQETLPGTGCESLSHWIHLHGADLSAKERDIVRTRYAPTLHEPGSYGSWSTALCFNASSIFVDNTRSKVHRVVQFFQAEVVAVPTEKRRHNKHSFNAAEHRTFSAYAAAAAELGTRNATDAAAHRSQCLAAALDARFETLTSPQLGKMLRQLDARQKITRFVSGQYDVRPMSERERKLYNIHENTTLTLFIIIGLVGGLMTCAFVLCFISNRRVSHKKTAHKTSDSGAQSDDDEESF